MIEVYAAGLRRTIASSFVSPSGLAVDLNGILYIADAGADRVYTVYSSPTRSEKRLFFAVSTPPSLPRRRATLQTAGSMSYLCGQLQL